MWFFNNEDKKNAEYYLKLLEEEAIELYNYQSENEIKDKDNVNLQNKQLN